MFNKNYLTSISLHKGRTINKSTSSSNLCSSFDKQKEKIFFNSFKKVSKILSLSTSDSSHNVSKMKLYFDFKKRLRKPIKNSSLLKYYNYNPIKKFYLTEYYKNNLKNNNNLNTYSKVKHSSISFDSIEKKNYDIDEDYINKIKSSKLNFHLMSLIGNEKLRFGLKNNCIEINKIKSFEKEKMTRLKNLINRIKEQNYLLDCNISTIKFNIQRILEICEENDLYLKFLSKYYEEQLKICNKLFEYRKKEYNEVKKLEFLFIKINNKFHQLKDMRDFLIKVKEKTINLPSFFSLLEKGIDTFENVDKNEVERYKKYLNVNIPIFENIDEFETIFSFSGNNTLNLIYGNEKVQNELETLKSELNELNNKNNIQKEKNINLLIEKKEILIQKNKDLQKILSELKKKKENNVIKLNEYKSSYKNENDINFNKRQITIMKYNSIIKKYSMSYSFMLEKLIHQINYFYKNKIITKDIINTAITYEFISFNDILYCKIKTMTQEKIYHYILICLQLYEKILIMNIKKYHYYLNNESSKNEMTQLIKKRKNEVNDENIKEKKELIKNKFQIKIKNLEDKLNKHYLKQFSKEKSTDFSYFIKKKNKKQKSTNDIKKKEDNIFDFLEN